MAGMSPKRATGDKQNDTHNPASTPKPVDSSHRGGREVKPTRMKKGC